MKVLLLGSGGREHALARQIAKSPLLTALYIAPGNPGTSEVGENLDLDITDNAAIVTAAETHAVDLVVVGPEAPLVAGAGDALRRAGFAVFGPNRAAAALEGSKAFAKTVMEAAAVPTAAAVPCATLEQASAALQRFGAPYVVKQDGLAAGKGVVVTSDFDAAMQHAQACIDALGPAAGRDTALVIEEYLDGPEASVFCLSDGHAPTTTTKAPTLAAWVPTPRCRGPPPTWPPTRPAISPPRWWRRWLGRERLSWGCSMSAWP